MKNTALSLLLSLIALPLLAQTIQEGKKYRIESNFDLNWNKRSGAIGLGKAHGGTSSTYYVKDGNYTADCYWYFENDGTGKYYLKNAQSGEYALHKKNWEDLTLTTGKPQKDPNGKWRLIEQAGGFIFFVKSDEQYVMQYGSTNKEMESVSTERKEADVPFMVFNIYDESGNKLDPHALPPYTNAPEGEIPTVSTPLKAYLTDLKINNREVSYYKKNGWLAVKPNEQNVSVSFTPANANVTAELTLDGAAVTSSAQITTDKKYTLIVKESGAQKATAEIAFTTLPIMDIRHEGKLGTGMFDYLWGEMRLSDADTPETVFLSSRYRSRGATASKYTKHSMNMKLRLPENDQEVDSTLLKMRSASSWILDAMAIDRVRMRNRVCFDIWNDMHKLPYETKFGSRSGTIGRYVEVIENGEYKGIYCLTDRINGKLLNVKDPKIDEMTGEVKIRGMLYKAKSWDSTGLNEDERNQYLARYGDTRNSAYWCNWDLAEPEDYPCKEVWQPLDDLYFHAGDVPYYKSKFFINNLVDYHLFLNVFHIVDNGNKNQYMGVRDASAGGDDAKMFIAPWDLDTSLGGSFDGAFWNGTYQSDPIGDIRVNKNYPFVSLFQDAEYHKMLQDRWVELRDNLLAPWKIAAKMNEYALQFINSGAWQREGTANGWMPGAGAEVPQDLLKEIQCIKEYYQKYQYEVDDYLGVPHSTGISAVRTDKANSSEAFNIAGQKVDNLYKGLIIKNGKKIIR